MRSSRRKALPISKRPPPGSSSNPEKRRYTEYKDGSSMVQKRRALLYLPFVIALSSLVGGLYGPRVEVASAANEDDIRTSLKVFTKVYNVVEENFADPLNPDKAVYKGAIPACCVRSIRT